MSHTHTPAEWAQMASLSVGIFETCSVFWFLFVDAEPADFDPRPLVRRLLITDAAARLTVAVFNAKTAVRDAAIDAAALVVLLTTSPKGAMA